MLGFYNSGDRSWSSLHAWQALPPTERSCDILQVFFPQELSNSLFAYFRGGQLPWTNIYFSDNGGFSFQYLVSEKLVSGWGKSMEGVAPGRPHPFSGSVGN